MRNRVCSYSTDFLNEHPSDVAASRGGPSIGRWEDDVLVVDTVGFEPGLELGHRLEGT